MRVTVNLLDRLCVDEVLRKRSSEREKTDASLFLRDNMSAPTDGRLTPREKMLSQTYDDIRSDQLANGTRRKNVAHDASSRASWGVLESVRSHGFWDKDLRAWWARGWRPEGWWGGTLDECYGCGGRLDTCCSRYSNRFCCTCQGMQHEKLVGVPVHCKSCETQYLCIHF